MLSFNKEYCSWKNHEKNEKHNCGSAGVFLKVMLMLEIYQKKNDEAIQIPQELGKCQLNSNREEKQ